MLTDVVIVGGGPAGLAAAIGGASRGLRVMVLEKRNWPLDKACGEGLMPSGLRALDRLGALALIDRTESSPFAGVRYVQEDGSFAEARFVGQGGLGIRRTALTAALAQRADDLGVILRPHTKVRGFRLLGDRVSMRVDGEPIEARLLVAADGLASPLRHCAGLDLPTTAPRRFGVRQHFRCPAFSPFVEVHFADGVEAYVTPAGAVRVGVAFLWDVGKLRKHLLIEELLDSFPAIRERLRGASPDSEPRGAGPLFRAVRTRTADRFVLLGDAAGYVDAITGEGLSLAFHCAEALAAILPSALARGAGREALRPYEEESARAYRRYSLVARGVLGLSRHPSLRHAIVRLLGRQPWLFDALLGWAVNDSGTRTTEGELR